MKNRYTKDLPITLNLPYKQLSPDGKTKLYCPLEKPFLDLLLQEIVVDEIYKPKKKGKVCVDLGANIGLASLYLRNYFDEIHAVEPVDLYYDALKKNLKPYKNIKTYQYAIAAYNRKGKFYSPKDIVPQSFYDLPRKGEFNMTNVNSITLEKFMDDNNIENIDYLKMDVEGAEYEIFFDKSFARIAHRIKNIIGEAHVRPDGGGHPSSIPYALDQCGFHTEWKPLEKNNYWYTPRFTNSVTKVTTVIKVPMWTIFEAKRKDAKNT